MATLLEVQPGWKVFAQGDEIGQVVDVGPTTFDVRKGMLIQHTYRIPEAAIAEAADGLVDLRIDRETVETMEVDTNGDVAVDEIPDEYLRIELGERVDVRPDPRDGTSIVP